MIILGCGPVPPTCTPAERALLDVMFSSLDRDERHEATRAAQREVIIERLRSSGLFDRWVSAAIVLAAAKAAHDSVIDEVYRLAHSPDLFGDLWDAVESEVKARGGQ